jgi:hypothetical protein
MRPSERPLDWGTRKSVARVSSDGHPERPCKFCKTPFKPKNPDRKYCKIACSHMARRKVKVRPDRTQLEKDVSELGWEGTGRKYGVTYNAVKSWAKACGMLQSEV